MMTSHWHGMTDHGIAWPQPAFDADADVAAVAFRQQPELDRCGASQANTVEETGTSTGAESLAAHFQQHTVE